jgi:uncharacterized membrane protein
MLMEFELFNRQYYKTSNLWIAPIAGFVLALFIATGSIYLDSRIEWQDPAPVFFQGSADTARSLLSVIASSVTTLLALIFTIIVVAIQLASSQYSPRTVAILLQDKPSHFTIGNFVFTFTYTVVVLLMLRFTESFSGENVTGISLTLAFVFAVISLCAFAVYSNHIIHAVRVSSLINRIGMETREAIENLYPKEGAILDNRKEESLEKAPDHEVLSEKVGVIVEINQKEILKIAKKNNCTIKILPIVGAFLPEGAPLIHIYGKKPENLMKHIKIMTERTMERNILYGFRQLADMAVRANSTGINDPASSVQVIDQLHDLLRRMINRPINDLYIYDDAGVLRLFLRLPQWEDILHVAIDEIRLYGATSIQVVKRLRALLYDLYNIAPTQRKNSIKIQIDLLDKDVKKNFGENEHVFHLAMEADMRGTGF